MKESQLRSAFFLTLLLGVLVLVFFIVQPYLVTLAIAATATVILHPVHKKIVQWVRGRKTPAAFLMVLLTIVLILVPLILIGIQIATEAANLYGVLQEDGALLPADLLSRLENLLGQYLPGLNINITQYAGQALQWIAGNLQDVFAGTVRTVFPLFPRSLFVFLHAQRR